MSRTKSKAIDLANESQSVETEVVEVPTTVDPAEYRGNDYGTDELLADMAREDIEIRQLVRDTLLVNDGSMHVDDLCSACGLDTEGLFNEFRHLDADGYALVVKDTGMILFGQRAMLDLLEQIEAKPTVVNKIGRKQEVLDILLTGKHVTVGQIAKSLGINERNVSSQLSYLRKDNYRIATDSRGYKFLEA